MWKSLDIYYMAPAEGEAPGNAPAPATPDIATLQKQFDETKTSNSKLEAKNAELLNEVKKIKEQFKDIDPVATRALLEKFKGDEELRLIAEGKHDEVIKKRTEKISAEFGAKLQTAQEELENTKKMNAKYTEKISTLLIDSDLAQIFLEEGGEKTALKDFKMRAREIWKLEGEDDVVPRDEKGELIKGKSGILTKEEWVAKLKEDAPHLFPRSSGANLVNNGGRKISTGNIDVKLEAARKAGDTDEVRRLRDLKKQGKRDA